MKSKQTMLILIALTLGCGLFWFLNYSGQANGPRKSFEVNLSEDEWKAKLTPEQFYVLRQAGTERAGTSPLNKEKNDGTFHCAGCGEPLFSSETKFDSGTGWPSFYKPLPDAVETEKDYKMVVPRTEVHCATCGGHLGHVFEDGPQPTGLRYCMNGVALKFEGASETP